MGDTYTAKFERKWCPKCHGNGWKMSIDPNGYEVARPCDCEEGQQRRAALTRPKGTEKDGE